MTARRHLAVAVVAAIVAVLLWWLARDLVVVEIPDHEMYTGGHGDAPGGPGGESGGGSAVPGSVTRTVFDPWLVLGAAVAAGVCMVATTLSLLRAGDARRGRTGASRGAESADGR